MSKIFYTNIPRTTWIPVKADARDSMQLLLLFISVRFKHKAQWFRSIPIQSRTGSMLFSESGSSFDVQKIENFFSWTFLEFGPPWRIFKLQVEPPDDSRCTYSASGIKHVNLSFSVRSASGMTMTPIIYLMTMPNYVNKQFFCEIR